MPDPSTTQALERAHVLAVAYLDGVADRPVAPTVELAALRASLGGPLPSEGEDPAETVAALAAAADPGLVATAGPRYFGFVIGGAQPAALAADWLASTWDQNVAMYVMSPAAAVVEEVVEGWLVDVFGLPAETSVGFTTGATMANFTALAAARHRVLADVGWPVEERGLFGAPEITVLVGEESHVTILVALQMLGLGRERIVSIEADEQGRMRADVLAATLAQVTGPVIVCAQAGNVNTGAFDPLAPIAAAVRERGGWLHVDGAFGLWAAAAPGRRDLVDGLADADSWTTDNHKWLNVPYDSGVVLIRDRAAHREAMTLGASYYVESDGGERDGYNWVPESSRRARGFAVWAALRSLGRDGLAAQIERGCRSAVRMAGLLAAEPGVAILNDVVLNQVLVRFDAPGHDAETAAAASDALTRDVIARVQADGTCWLGGTTWHGVAAMRLSVSGWNTTDDDIDRSAEAILRCARAARAALRRDA
jgi:glutamate/tyrosine decarboxylase-like PLP-dependent enzyme